MAAERAECQVCCRHQALRNGVLVNHGYQRPGWGWLVGGCFGTAHKPFPATDALEKAVEHAKAEAIRLRAWAETTITVQIPTDGYYVGKTRMRHHRDASSSEEYEAIRDELGPKYMASYQTYEDQLVREKTRIRKLAAQADEAAGYWAQRITEGEQRRER